MKKNITRIVGIIFFFLFFLFLQLDRSNLTVRKICITISFFCFIYLAYQFCMQIINKIEQRSES
jgi:hypothetical protein